jgi:hypothetical protein
VPEVPERPERPERRNLGQRALDAERQRRSRRQEAQYRPGDPVDPVTGGQPEWYRSLPNRSTLRWLLVVFVGIVVVTILRSSHSHPPPLATSCTTPGLALSTSSVKQSGAVRWSATGPAHTEVVLAIGVRGFRANQGPNQLRAIPDAGRTPAGVEQASPLLHIDSGCRLHGVFSADVTPGHYQVRLFRVTSVGTSLSATPVVSRPLTVD